MDEYSSRNAGALMQSVLYEVKRIVVGQDHFLERVLVAILAQGHLLVEGVPGLAKTLTVNTLAKTIRGQFKRIQFTPDLLPADLIGTRMYNQRSGEFSTVLGPVFTNLLLADEINRAPAKVQSALLEVMQERQVTIAGESHRVPEPFLVMATQNPIETEGTYPLPEAQVDRFMMKVLVGYPSEEEEFVIVERVTGAATTVSAVCSTSATDGAAGRVPQDLRRPGSDAVRSQAGLGDAPARALQLEGHDALHHVRRESTCHDQLDRRCTRVGVPSCSQLRAARGRDRSRAGRDAPSIGIELRSAVRRLDGRSNRDASAAGHSCAG